MLTCAVMAAGCAEASERGAAEDTASRFLRAVADGDTGSACALLTPSTRDDLATSDGPCAETLPVDRLSGAVTGADTWSDWAKVDTDAGALFLTEYGRGWLVSAAGCRPEADAPYQCVVGG